MVATGSSAKHGQQNDRRDSHRGNRSASNKKSRKSTGLGNQSATVGAAPNRVASAVNIRDELAVGAGYSHHHSKRGENTSIGSAKKVSN